MILDKDNFDINSSLRGDIYIKESFSYPLSDNEVDKVSKKVIYNNKKSGVVGEVLVYLEDSLIHKEKLYLKESKISFFERILEWFK